MRTLGRIIIEAVGMALIFAISFGLILTAYACMPF
jgi:hypothetical protein